MLGDEQQQLTRMLLPRPLPLSPACLPQRQRARPHWLIPKQSVACLRSASTSLSAWVRVRPMVVSQGQ